MSLTANWRGQLRVGSIVTETPSVKTFRLVPSSSERSMPFTFVPGQFLNVAFWIGGARMNRSYSISSSPLQRDYVELTVRRDPRGAVSRHIDDLLKVGDRIEAGDPVGRFTFTGTEADSIVLIAGGVGITPMMSITRYLTERSWAGDIFFVYSCRVPTDFIFANEIAALQRVNPKLRIAVTMSNPEGTDWQGPRGRLTKELLTQTILDLSEELAIGIQNSCRVGTCGVCKVKMTSGEVSMAVEDALEPDDKNNGIILACQAKPKHDITVEA